MTLTTQKKRLSFFIYLTLLSFHFSLNSSELTEQGHIRGNIGNKISIAWEGSFIDLGSLSLVNRSLTNAIEKSPNITLTRVMTLKAIKTSDRISQSELESLNLLSKAPTTTQVTIRHEWPPNWEQPQQGKWVHIQPWEFGSLPKEWISKISNVDEVWCPSSYVKKVYMDSGIPESKLYVIPNGFDPEKFHLGVKPYPLQTKKKYKFLYLGATIYRKGTDILLNTYLKIFKKDDDVCLVIKDAGSQGYAGLNLEKELKQLQLRNDIPEIIYINKALEPEEIAGLYSACDCLVYPYRGEGFALPVLEAMACGIPVIVTAHGATDDFVTKDFGWFISAKKKIIGPCLDSIELAGNGWLLEPKPEKLAKQMLFAANHLEEGKAKGLAASKYAKENWTWHHAAAIAIARLKALTQPYSYSSSKTK